MTLDEAIEIARRRFTTAREEFDVPGIAFGVLHQGELAYVEGLGETTRGRGVVPDADSVFRIASMTKSFTAAAVLLLRDRGQLRLDDAVDEHCPWVAGIAVPDGSAPITVRDLLTMQAGLPTDDPWGDRQESLPIADFDALVAGGLRFATPPRSAFEYSNLGYALLGRVISQVSGSDYRDFVRSELLVPLGMGSTRFEAALVPADRLVQGYAPAVGALVDEPFTEPGAFSAMGGLLSSVRDLGTWVGGFVAALDAPLAAPAFDHPLSRASRREMQEPQRLVDTLVIPREGSTPRVVTTSYAYGLMTDDDHDWGRFVSHSGGYPGFGSHMRWHAPSGWGIIALGNRTYTNMRLIASQALLEIVEGVPRTRGPVLWPETVAAMDVAESLLARWDNDLADANLAMNVDLDQPRSERRDQWQALSAEVGSARRDEASPESDSPAHARWWVTGETGRVRLEVRLTPELPPRIQTLTATPESVVAAEPPADANPAS